MVTSSFDASFVCAQAASAGAGQRPGWRHVASRVTGTRGEVCTHCDESITWNSVVQRWQRFVIREEPW